MKGGLDETAAEILDRLSTERDQFGQKTKVTFRNITGYIFKSIENGISKYEIVSREDPLKHSVITEADVNQIIELPPQRGGYRNKSKKVLKKKSKKTRKSRTRF